jgi:NSS family neurotransmitter:Na+ symporter
MNMVEKREQWGSKLGFILAAAGSAIGLGNIWKFPYIAGENGGAAFVLVYLICILLIGTPVLIAEILLGRETQKNSIGAFKKLAQNKAWMIVGAMGVLAGFVILSFYSVIGGWAIGYVVESIKGTFFTFENADASGALFGALIGNAQWVLGMHTLFSAFVMGFVVFGVKKGIEFGSKVLMPILFS